jgi:hypothetical protein
MCQAVRSVRLPRPKGRPSLRDGFSFRDEGRPSLRDGRIPRRSRGLLYRRPRRTNSATESRATFLRRAVVGWPGQSAAMARTAGTGERISLAESATPRPPGNLDHSADFGFFSRRVAHFGPTTR